MSSARIDLHLKALREVLMEFVPSDRYYGPTGAAQSLDKVKEASLTPREQVMAGPVASVEEKSP